MANTDKVVATFNVYQTKDYDKFKTIKGNRNIDEPHVRSLQRSFLENGNRMDQEPMEVTDDFAILDGQHRFTGSKRLDMPVCYIIKSKVKNVDSKSVKWP